MRSKRHSFWLILVVLVGCMVMGLTAVSAQPRVILRFDLTPSVYVNIPRSPQVSLSVDRGEGSTYYEGDPITIRYRTTGGGYFNLVNYMTDGGVRVLVRNQFLAAGSNQVYNDTITGPSGTERLVALFTPDEVNESQLERFIREPHQAGRIFNRFQVNRTHYEVVTRVGGTSLVLDPVNFSMDEDASVILTATLRDASGIPLQGKELDWSVSAGSLTTYRSTTGPNGVARVTYYSPSAGAPSTVTINVRFSGDIRYSASMAQSNASISPRYQQSRLIIEPSSFTAEPGEVVRFVATLRDGAGSPVYGRTIFWGSDRGDFDRSSTITDSAGRVVVNYYPPDVLSLTNVTITGEFRGAPGLSPVSQNVFGTIEPSRYHPLSSTLFFLDFGTGSPVHNLTNFQRTGRIIADYATSGGSVLEMIPGDMVEFTFNPGGMPEKGAMLIWVQGQPRAKLNVRLNNRLVGSVTPVSGILEPDREKKLTLSYSDLVSGTNRVTLEVDGPRNEALRLQRVIIVF